MSTASAIHTQSLGRIYRLRNAKKREPKELVALSDVNIHVEPGELFGLLGPNGAGKTTLIKILTTLLAPSSGRAWVAGFDVTQDPAEIRTRINMVSGGESSGYGLLTVRENLWMFSQFYGIPSKQANQRIKHLLDIVGLGDRINTKSSDLSTGLRQKMNIVRGFMTDPDVLFLDEPTLGLDVGAARDVRRFIREWMLEDPQRTILLTTHTMEEADQLCDRVAIIHEGQVLACNTPAALKKQLQHETIFTLELSPLDHIDPSELAQLPGVRRLTHRGNESASTLELILSEQDALAQVIGRLAEEGIHLQNLEKRDPSLEDVFVHLVGHGFEEAERGEDD